ncbi:MAG: MAPEG family protein [Robiginitomaculum sp.]|nr:MAPEG family protein [Robiginitomaculum sp.]
MQVTTQLLAPMMVLIGWTLLMLIWMYAKRIPAMKKANIQPDDSLTKDLSSMMPLGARQVAANYNHLMEQPTIFYAAVLGITVMGHVDQVAIYSAWSYVGLRVIHSLVQNTYHTVTHRFLLFVLSSVALGVMVVRELLKLFV